MRVRIVQETESSVSLALTIKEVANGKYFVGMIHGGAKWFLVGHKHTSHKFISYTYNPYGGLECGETDGLSETRCRYDTIFTAVNNVRGELHVFSTASKLFQWLAQPV